MARGRRAGRLRVGLFHGRGAGRFCTSLSHRCRASGGGEDDKGHAPDVVAMLVHELEDILLGLDNR